MKLKNDELIKFPDGSVLEYKKGTDKSVIDAKKNEIILQMEKQQQPPTNIDELAVEQQDLTNAPLTTIAKSGGKFIKDMITPFTQPIQTAKDISALASSVVSTIRPGEQGNEQLARQVGQYFSDRYGGIENVKNSFLTDPVGVVGDLTAVLSIPFTGGGAIAARTLGTGSKVTQAIKKAGQYTSAADPANVAFKGAEIVGSKVITPVIGLASGTGKNVLNLAYEAGKSNDAKVRQDFIKNLAGKEDVTLIVEDVQKALEGFKENKQSTFNIEKNKLNLEKRKIDLSSLDNEINKIEDSFTTLGKLELNPLDVTLLKNIRKKIKEYQSDPKLQNALGADSLKRSIDDLMPTSLTKGRKADIIVTRARNAVKNIITKKVKNYNKVMKKYEEATNLQNQIVKELSTGNANKSTILRKLKSVFSDAGESRFASRGELLDTLEDYNPNISTRLAGQALSPLTPKGLSAITTGVGAYGLGTLNPKLLPLLVASSPKIAGGISYGAGNVARRMSTPVAGNLTGKDLLAELLRQSRLYQSTQGQ